MPLCPGELLLLCWSNEIKYHFKDERELFDYSDVSLRDLERLIEKSTFEAQQVLVVLLGSSDDDKKVISILPTYENVNTFVMCPMNKSKEVSLGLLNKGVFRKDFTVYGVGVNSRGVYDKDKKMRILSSWPGIGFTDDSITHFLNDVLNIDFTTSDIDLWGDFCKLLFRVKMTLQCRRRGYSTREFCDFNHQQLCQVLSKFTFSTDKYDLFHYTFSLNDKYEMTENRRKSCKRRKICFTSLNPEGQMFYQNSKGEWSETDKVEHRRDVRRREPYTPSDRLLRNTKQKEEDKKKSIREELLDCIASTITDEEEGGEVVIEDKKEQYVVDQYGSGDMPVLN